MGLMEDLIDAKLAGENIRRVNMKLKPWTREEIPKATIKEVELTRDAIINFLSSEDLVWTINKFKASVELEEIKTEALNIRVETDVDTKVDTSVSTTVNTTVNGGTVPVALGPVVGAAGVGTGTGNGKGTGTGTGKGTVTEGLNLRIDGEKTEDGLPCGGYLKAVGYAYIGDKEVDNVQNVSPDNTETEVRLDYDRIPEELK